jgi:starch-binding outer membrane protein, SusD/RagB family
MKSIINKIAIALSTVSLLVVSCTKDYTDPSRATEDQVFSSVKGLTGVVVGLQRVYTAGRASSLYNSVSINGLVTNEMILVNPGNQPELELTTGGTAVNPNNSMLLTYWSSNNKTIYDADKVLESASLLPDKNYASGLIAYASLFKALSIGNMAMYWEKVPDTIGVNVGFIDRVDGFNKAIAILDNAIAVITANPISSAFTSNIPVGIDIPNTLLALKARYSLFAGNYATALATANAVDLTKKSTFNFDAITQNPIFETSTSTNNVVQVKDSTLGLLAPLQPDAADKRVPFYTTINTTIAPRFRIKGFGDGSTASFPVYLPGEMILIKAEAYARQNDTTNGKAQLNLVVTKTTDPFLVAASLPPIVNVNSQANLLDQIYKHRCIELYMSGLKLEDMRRFGRPLTERKRNLMPYPQRERDNNPNTPPDPAF